MGSTTDKIKGTANEAMGKAKQKIGEATGSEEMQGEGAIQEAKGKGQKALGDAKEITKDAVNGAAAAANKKL
ncbi:CsbD family protein [Bradyrhizobium sp. B124]|uniref:CsbD family protein n=1 Tax=Bradyrhizobium sp. B124 TaxID=3140245 RepID=UPI0031842B0E